MTILQKQKNELTRSKTKLINKLIRFTILAITMNAIPLAEANDDIVKKISDKELHCIAVAVYNEARGDGYKSQVAVAEVVLNRMKHAKFPKDACSVVYQPKQFTNVGRYKNLNHSNKLYGKMLEVAETTATKPTTSKALFFTQGRFANLKYLYRVGSHNYFGYY